MIGRTGKRHPSDLTDDEWNHIATLLPAPEWRKRKLGVDAGGAECDPLHGAFGRRMANVSEGLPAAGRLSTAGSGVSFGQCSSPPSIASRR